MSYITEESILGDCIWYFMKSEVIRSIWKLFRELCGIVSLIGCTCITYSYKVTFIHDDASSLELWRKLKLFIIKIKAEIIIYKHRNWNIKCQRLVDKFYCANFCWFS